MQKKKTKAKHSKESKARQAKPKSDDKSKSKVREPKGRLKVKKKPPRKDAAPDPPERVSYAKKDPEPLIPKTVKKIVNDVEKDGDKKKKKEKPKILVKLKDGKEYKDDLKGWNFNKTQTCGAFKQILGGPGMLRKGAVLEKKLQASVP